jgi:oligopeptide/dipeptide ABC transporter ATP-binding protein
VTPAPGGALLEVLDLSATFATPSGPLRAVDGVSFAVRPGQAVGIVGESGSGKTVTALAVMGLLPGQCAVRGRVRLAGEDLLTLPAPRLRDLRGRRLAMVFQDPLAALDPSQRIGDQVAEPLRVHRRAPRSALRERAVALLEQVGLPAARERVDAYPHQLSGGMRQRVVIAAALACDPELVIADEPTTALDVTVQAQIMELLRRLQRERGMGLLLISHDLGLVAESCDELVVMYAGQVVERGPTAAVLEAPAHPYTAALLASTPVPGSGRGRLVELPGMVPDLAAPPPGCRFHDRCPFSQARCRELAPAAPDPAARRGHRCHFPLGGAA